MVLSWGFSEKEGEGGWKGEKKCVKLTQEHR